MHADSQSETPSVEQESRSASPASLSDVLDRICQSDSAEQISFKTIVEALDQRAYGPLLFVPAVIAVAPTGAIPGMSLITGTIILLLSAQLLCGRRGPWLPASVLGFSFSRDRLERVIQRSRRYAVFVDRYLKPRLTFMVSFPVNRVVALVCIILALTMYPLALLPFAVAVPGTATALMALGLTTRDGLLVLAGILIGLGALGLAVFWGAFIGYYWF